jgi:hypothetical protein
LIYLDNPLPPENVVMKTVDMSWKNYADAILKGIKK